MKPNLDIIRDNGITAEILNILTNSHSIYFNAKGLRFELYRKHGFSLRGRPPSNLNIYNDWKKNQSPFLSI